MAAALEFLQGNAVTLVAGISGGISADMQQQQINDRTCDLYKNMVDYNNTMNEMLSAEEAEYLNYYSQVSDLNFQIADLQNQIKQDQVQFKQTYYQYVTLSIIFIVLVILALLCKKIIFKGPKK